MRKIDMTTFLGNPTQYELRNGNTTDAPNCPYGNKYTWIGYDLKNQEYIRFTKSVFKKLVNEITNKR